MRILKSSKHGWQCWISRLPPLNKQRVKQRSPLGAHRCAPTGSDGIPSNTVRLNDDISISHPGLPGSQALDLLMVGLGSAGFDPGLVMGWRRDESGHAVARRRQYA